jgi:ankyrin repeat protein
VNANNTREINEEMLLACARSTQKSISALLLKGANVEVRDSFGRTPMHLAASVGNLEVLKELAEAGANTNSVDRYYRTPLHSAICGLNDGDLAAVIDLLLHLGANPELRDSSLRTPSEWAQKVRRTDISALLGNSVTGFHR